MTAERTVGSYVLERRLGRGGMGEVWLGRHRKSGSVAAIKLFGGGFADDEPIRTFHTECRAIARLSHPNIVGLYEYGESHLALGYIDGTSLRRRMQSPLAPSEVWSICRQIASALEHAHDRGVIHRDVKPSNILLDTSGNAFLADFGIAVVRDDAPEERRPAGTPAFMAPEQARGEAVTPAVDQYALARTLIAALTGETPDTHAPLGDLPDSIGPSARDVLSRALAESPAERWPSIDAFATALLAIDVSEEPAARRLARLRRPTDSYEWLAAATSPRPVGPGIHRADLKLSRAFDAAELASFRAASGWADVGLSAWTRTDRLGPANDPTAAARASEVVLLVHGWGMTRHTWESIALAACRDNPQAIVLAPDIAGFGDCTLDRDAEPALAPVRVYHTMLSLLRLLGLRELPCVVVGHSMSALGLLCAVDDDSGPAPYRVAIAPVVPWKHGGLRRQLRTGAWMLRTVGRVELIRRQMLRNVLRDAPAARLNATDRKAYGDALMSVPAPVLADIASGILRTRPPEQRTHLRRCIAISGTEDPLMTADAFREALASVDLVPGHVRTIATATHFPHLENPARPEDTARNTAEIITAINHMLIAARHGTELLSTPPAGHTETMSTVSP